MTYGITFKLNGQSNILTNVFVYYTNQTHSMPNPVAVRSNVADLLGLWVRILQEAWIFVSGECCMLLGTGLRVGLIIRPEESYRM